MLLRPPFIKQQDVKSQSSNAISHIQKQVSVKSSSKNKKKQNSLGMKKNNNIMHMQYEQQNQSNNQNYDSDNGSVHSVNSRKSKGKTKESTLAIGKKQSTYQNYNQNSAYSIKNQNDKQQYEIFKIDSDDDNKSIGSHASKNSKKNTVKQNSLGKNRNNKVNVQLNYYYNKKQEEESPKTYYLEEQSKVQTVRLNQNIDPQQQPFKYNQALKGGTFNKNVQNKNRRTQQPKPKQNYSPFQQITIKKQQQHQEPVYKLKQPEQPQKNKYNPNNNVFGQRVSQNKFNQQNNNFFGQKNAFVQPKISLQIQNKKQKVDIQQSSIIQPQMISTKSVTKSRRNKIFDNDNNSIANSSNIMTSRSNLDGSFDKSRSKSKSKLGELLKQSRQKKAQLVNSRQKQIVPIKPTKVLSPLHNKNNFFQDNQQKTSKPNIKESNDENLNLIKIQKSNLISVSTLHQQSRIGGQKLGQNVVKIQQIKPKTVNNQVFDLGQSRQSNLQLNLSMSNRQPHLSGIKNDSVHFNFQPQKKKGISITSKEKPSAQSKSIQSKKHLDRLMKKCQQNQQFLAKSILSNNSQLRTSQKPIPSPSPLNKNQQKLNRPFEKIKQPIVQQQPSWHQLVKDDAAFQIKHVQRKQIKRNSQQQIKYQQKPKIQQKKVTNIQQPQVQTAKGPQFLLQNPVYRGNQQRTNNQIKNSQVQNFYKQQRNENIAKQQKNRILANMQKKSKVQKQRQFIQKPNIIINEKRNNKQQQNRIENRNNSIQKQKPMPQQNKSKQTQNLKQKIQSSSISQQFSLSQNGSERSNSQKKNKKKQTSLNIMKKHKVQVRDQSPRAEQSFYQQPPKQYTKQYSNPMNQYPLSQKVIQPQRSPKMQSSRNNKNEYKQPNLLNFQQSQNQDQQKVKSKTDINFYNHGDMSQKSMKPPSSKPPLSRKSGASSSKSKSKAKQSTLNINVVKKQNKMTKNNHQKNIQPQPKKKKTLFDIAQDKDYEGSGYGGSDSQCSFNSRESFGSVNSRGSRKSSRSKKQSTLPITIKNKATTLNDFRPSLNKITSTASQVQIYQTGNQSIYNQLPQQSMKKTSRQRERYQQQLQQQRTIVSKDTYFIDQRGRLVKQDLVIQGNKVYGKGTQKSAEQMAMQRMRRSRQHHRSRSKSRDGSRSRLSRKDSRTSYNQGGYESSSSSNYFNGQDSNYNSNYNSNYMQKQNLYIQQFVKPIQQPISPNQNYKFQKPSNSRRVQNQRNIQREFYQNQQQPYDNQQYQEQQPVRNITLNELFGRNQKQPQNNSKTNYQNNLYTNNNQKSKYGGNQSKYGNNSKFNNQQSSMRQSGRKKSLSRTQKTFYNR